MRFIDPLGPLWARKIWDFYSLRRSPRRTTSEKISRTPRGQTRHFWEKHVFLHFSRILRKYRISVNISINYAPKKRPFIAIDPQGVAGNYGALIFILIYQVDELRNQKCGTHIKKLTAMKFRNSEKLSHHLNKLERTYLEKNKNWVKVQKSNYRGTFFLFFYLLKKNFVVFKNFRNLIADSKRQYSTSYKWVSTRSS